MKKNNTIMILVFFLLILSLILIINMTSGQNNAFARENAFSEEFIEVIPLQIDRDTYGLAMVDPINQTVWVYGLDGRGGGNNIRLLAARSWKYDRLMEQYNTADPKPAQIKEFLQKLGVSADKKADLTENEMLKIVEPDK